MKSQGGQNKAVQPAANAAPDLSKYVYDDKSGYYYDAAANLYYDAKTQYFYNPLTQLFSYWDNERGVFVPASGGADGQAGPAAGQDDKAGEKNKEKPDKQDKVRVIKPNLVSTLLPTSF